MKMASDDQVNAEDKAYAKTLMDAYGMYKLAYINHVCETKGNFLIDEKDKLIFTCHNRII